MKTSDAFPSRWLGHDDIDGDVTVTIEAVRIEEMQRSSGTSEKLQKPTVQFVELEKPMVLNKTNWLRIAAAHGEESDAWKGKRVALTVERVRFGNEWFESLRIQSATAKASSAPSAAVRFSGEWRAIPIHFGKNNGKLLGSLPPNVLRWYQEEWQPRPNPKTRSFSGTDLQLRSALDASLRDGARSEPAPVAPEPNEDVPF